MESCSCCRAWQCFTVSVFQISSSYFNTIFLDTACQNLSACRIRISRRNKPFPFRRKRSLCHFISSPTYQSITVVGRRQKREKVKNSIHLFPVVFFIYGWLLRGCWVAACVPGAPVVKLVSYLRDASLSALLQSVRSLLERKHLQKLVLLPLPSGCVVHDMTHCQAH